MTAVEKWAADALEFHLGMGRLEGVPPPKTPIERFDNALHRPRRRKTGRMRRSDAIASSSDENREMLGHHCGPSQIIGPMQLKEPAALNTNKESRGSNTVRYGRRQGSQSPRHGVEMQSLGVAARNEKLEAPGAETRRRRYHVTTCPGSSEPTLNDLSISTYEKLPLNRSDLGIHFPDGVRGQQRRFTRPDLHGNFGIFNFPIGSLMGSEFELNTIPSETRNFFSGVHKPNKPMGNKRPVIIR